MDPFGQDANKPVGGQVLKRDNDSLDDFEHLGHDSSPLQELRQTDDLLGLKSTIADTHEQDTAKINIQGVGKLASDLQAGDSLLDQPLIPEKMDSNILDTFAQRKEADEKLEKFLGNAPPPLEPIIKHDTKNLKSFLDNEREFIEDFKEKEKSEKGSTEMLERYTDSEPESDDFKASKHDTSPKQPAFGSAGTFKSTENFKDVQEEHPMPSIKEIPPPAQEIFKEAKQPEPSKPVEVVKKPAVDVPVEKKTEPVQKVEEKLQKKPEPASIKHPETLKITEAEALFCKMGLDAWFNPERLNPQVESLIYWRDPKRSGPVFGGVLVILLALTYFSLISVVAYLSLFVLTGTIAFRIYKNIIQAVQKTGDGHPFKQFLELDVSLSQDKVREVSEVAVAHLNAGVVELRRLFLVEDLVDSIKFGVLLWTLTYLGSWFNGMTLVIIAWVALFTLPKVYETNKTQIDANLQIVRTKLCEITSKVKAAIPLGKKSEEKKD